MRQNIKSKEKNIKFKIYTFGCKTNQSESDFISGQLAGSGFEYVSNDESADFIIINTCTVTSVSDRKARHLTRKIKKENPTALIIAAGCFVKFNKDFLKEEGIEYYFENSEKDRITDFVENYFSQNNLKDSEKDSINLNGSDMLFALKHTRQLVKIQDGCEQYCSYCIVPVVRPFYKSSSPEAIIKIINEISSAGISEAVLTGIHIGKYGIDFARDGKNTYKISNIYQLITYILENTDIERIRLSSLEINEISDNLIDLINSEKRIAPHLHIPLQSGSSKILNRMKRPYEMDYFYERIFQINKRIKRDSFLALTTDIIAGFPGEEDDDFNLTLEALNKIKFSKTHVFKYSPRKNTAAYEMKNQIKEEVKSRRSLELRNTAYKLRNDFLNKNLKKNLEVLVEKVDGSKKEASGMSENYIKVYFGSRPYSGKNIKGKIIKVNAETLFKDGIKGSAL